MPEDNPMSPRASRTEGASASPLAVEIATYRQDGDGHYVPGVAWEKAEGFAVYIRNPLASHIRDFPVKMSRVLALQAARAFANTLAVAMDAPVTLNWPGEENAQTPEVVGGNTSPAALALAHCIDALTPPRGEEERDAVEMAQAALKGLRNAPAAQAAPGLNIEQAAENAACLWEAALEILFNGSATSPVVQRALAQKERDGMAALRNTVCHLVGEAEAAWDALGENVQYTMAFDWEFCPAWLYHALGWTDEAPTFGPQVYEPKGEAPSIMQADDILGGSTVKALAFVREGVEYEVSQRQRKLVEDLRPFPEVKVAPVESVTIVKRMAVNGGERLTMADGSTWFHPFNGGAPVREA